MYKDSDGYILIDMSGADISKSSQSINGFYDRIVESINTNKLVLVINFGDYSPMPAIAHKKLNYYVITTSLYIITINSNDIVIIQEAGESTVDVSIIPALQDGVKIADFSIGELEGSLYAPEQENIINDNVTADNTTWSSDKIDSELDTKVDASSLAAVATSGSYNDLTNTPVLADVAISGSYTDLTNTPVLAAVATSGSYNDLTNKPTIPADLDDLSDVTLTTPTNGQTLVYDATESTFVNATPPSGVTTLAGLSDVSLSTPASGNSLVYDGTDWSNTTIDAADIPYSAGVSVADKIDSLNTPTELTLNVASGITSASKAYQISDKVILVNFECNFASASSSYVNCFTIDWLTAFSTSNFAVVSDGGTNQGYIQAYWTGSTIQVRMDSPKAVRYRGQLYIIAV